MSLCPNRPVTDRAFIVLFSDNLVAENLKIFDIISGINKHFPYFS